MVWVQVYYCKCLRKDPVTMTTDAWISSGKFSSYGTNKIIASLLELLFVKLKKILQTPIKINF